MSPLRRRTAVRAAATVAGIAGMAAFAVLVAISGPGVFGPRSLRLVAAVRDADRGAEALLQEVTLPVERALRGWPAVRELTTWTRDGEVRLAVTLDGCGARWLGQTACDDDVWALALRRRLLDAGVDRGAGAVAVLVDRAAAATGGLDVAILGDEPARSAFALDVVRPALLGAGGAERVDVYGAARPRVEVTPLGAELAARGASPDDLARALCALGSERAAGSVLDGGLPRPVSVRERVSSFDALARWPVQLGAATVPLGDVAELALAPRGDGTLARVGGESAVVLRATGDARAATAALAALRLPAGLRWSARRIEGERPVQFEGTEADIAASFERLARQAPRVSDHRAGTGDAALGGSPARDERDERDEIPDADWALWVPDRPAALDAPSTLGGAAPLPGAPRGLLLAARDHRPGGGPATRSIADSPALRLGAAGLLPIPPGATELWITAADAAELPALAARAAAASSPAERSAAVEEAASGAPVADREEPRTRLPLRPELDASTRATLAADLAAARGREDCGRVEIPGAWPTLALAATRVPRLELTPVHLVAGQPAVPLAAALSGPPLREPAATIVRRNGWPALVLRFASRAAAETARRRLTAAPVQANVQPITQPIVQPIAPSIDSPSTDTMSEEARNIASPRLGSHRLAAVAAPGLAVLAAGAGAIAWRTRRARRTRHARRGAARAAA